MLSQTIQIPPKRSRWMFVGAAVFHVGGAAIASEYPQHADAYLFCVAFYWLMFLTTDWRSSKLAFDSDGIVFHGHRVLWNDVSSIEPPNARGEIVIRLRREVPDVFRKKTGGGTDWLLVQSRGMALDAVGVYALLVGASREAEWLLGSGEPKTAGFDPRTGAHEQFGG